MSVQEGFNRYACDVGGCGKVNYDREGGTYAVRYVERKWIDANFQQRSATFCTDHAAQFDAIVRAHDADFAAFMKNGTVPSGVTTTTTATTTK